jgi:2,4-dienoyl-CoA reductase-like NADH-dependent reductase (Old Yellow Enzyme family)
VTDSGSYRHLLSPLRIRNTTLPNRVVFAPVCPTWVRSPHEAIFTEQAVAYYEERARTGLGMIILGGHLINKDTIYTPELSPLSHPAMGRVVASFEPCWLGDATGRGAEPST